MSKKKPTVVILYGPIAVGKLTTAKLLAKKIRFKLAHNHALNDAVRDVFPRGNKEYSLVVEKLRFTFLREAVRAGADLVVTHCYDHNFINEATGVSDPEYVQKQKHMLTRAGARVCIVHLKADTEVLLERVTGESRKEWGKLTDVKIMKQCSKYRDWQTSAPIRDQLVIDNTNLSPKKVVDIIINHFNLK